MEIWKDLRGYRGFYQVSNTGYVRSIERIDNTGQRRKSKVLKANLDGFGYRKVSLSKNGVIRTAKIAKLVAVHFIPRKRGACQVDHIDRNRQHDHVENLRWVTRSENQNNRAGTYTSRFNGVHRNARGQKWVASVGVQGKKVYLGCFANEYAAAEAFNSYVIKNKLARVLNISPKIIMRYRKINESKR